jgi:hypothetical protein
MIDTLIILADPRTAINANQNANGSCHFVSLGSQIRPSKNKFSTIIFGCKIPTAKMNEWTKQFVENFATEDANIVGIKPLPTPTPSPVDEVMDRIVDRTVDEVIDEVVDEVMDEVMPEPQKTKPKHTNETEPQTEKKDSKKK